MSKENAAEPDALRNRLRRHGQEHVLAWWPELNAAERDRLAQQLASVDLELVQRLFAEAAGDDKLDPAAFEPPPVQRLPGTFEEWEREQEAVTAGDRALKAGQVAILLVAGGQGTRLGYDGPKGCFPIGPVSGKTLFQIHAEKVLALGRRYETPLPFLIMTSPENDAATRAYFAEHAYFGLDPANVTFFCQGMMPALDRATGKLLLAERGELALSPNGHGGVLQALADGGHLADLSRRGVKHIFFFQVDNPLARVADPAYLGYHALAGAEMSLKVVPKLYPGEKLGVAMKVGDKLQIIEYSDLPRELAEARGADGQLLHWAGSIAIHVFDVAFLERLAAGGLMLPFHRALKKVSCLDAEGRVIEPKDANAVKFEMFVFDALPLARKVLTVETSRREEFEPLKNAEGENSPATVRQALCDLHADWLRHAGVEVARRPDGSAAVPIEISPLYALDAEELRAKLRRTEPVTEALLLEEPSSLRSI